MRTLPKGFSPVMANALWYRRKTETRRLGDKPGYAAGDRLWVREAWRVSRKWDDVKPSDLPPRSMTTYYEAGGEMSGITPYEGDRPAAEYLWSKCDAMPDWVGKLRPGMFMMPWQSRLTLEVTEVCVERLQDISHASAMAEGIMEGDGSEDRGIFYLPESWRLCGVNAPKGKLPIGQHPDPRLVYRDLINNLHGGDLWSQNPWVVVTRFLARKVNFEALV
jgi:hypothetical protein